MTRHAAAANAVLTLAVLTLAVLTLAVLTLAVLTAEDNGRCLTSGKSPGHLGLRTMAERARRIGGVYAISSQPGVGTTVTVTVPRG